MRQPATIALPFLVVLLSFLALHLYPLLIPRDDDRIELRKVLTTAQLVEQFYANQQEISSDAPHRNGSSPTQPAPGEAAPHDASGH